MSMCSWGPPDGSACKAACGRAWRPSDLHVWSTHGRSFLWPPHAVHGTHHGPQDKWMFLKGKFLVLLQESQCWLITVFQIIFDTVINSSKVFWRCLNLLTILLVGCSIDILPFFLIVYENPCHHKSHICLWHLKIRLPWWTCLLSSTLGAKKGTGHPSAREDWAPSPCGLGRH